MSESSDLASSSASVEAVPSDSTMVDAVAPSFDVQLVGPACERVSLRVPSWGVTPLMRLLPHLDAALLKADRPLANVLSSDLIAYPVARTIVEPVPAPADETAATTLTLQTRDGLQMAFLLDGPTAVSTAAELAGRPVADELLALRAHARSLACQLDIERTRRLQAEQRETAQRSALLRTQRTLHDVIQRNAALGEELDALERRWDSTACDANQREARKLQGRTILYVGGRADTGDASSRLAQLQLFVLENGGRFLHHDGDLTSDIDGLHESIREASVVFVPLDGVTASAMTIVKQSCRRAGRACLPLRSSGLGSLVSALGRLDDGVPR